MFTLSLSLIFSSATVYFRDIPHILGSLFMVDRLLPFLLFSIIFLYFSSVIFQRTKKGFGELL